MNSVPGIVESVIKDDLFAQVNISCDGYMFSACILISDDEMPYSKIGTSVAMTFKESDTIISLHHDCSISCCNKFVSKINSIISGPVITRVTAEFNGIPIVSMVTSDSARQLKLENGANIVCMVKSTSIMLYLRNS